VSRQTLTLNIEDAERYLIRWLRTGGGPKSGYSNFGYDFYLPNAMRDLLGENGYPHHELEGAIAPLSPSFYAAAWELCRRGIIRPGIRVYGGQATSDGGSGNGYSITPFGRQWLAENDRDDFVPTEPGRFAQMLEPYRDRLGPAFYERAQEAVRCYGARAHLACCAMSGAAAESILLATAIAKTGDASSVLATYNGAQGRSRTENLIIGKAREQLQREFRGFLALLKYWRDQASHGKATNITDNEAFTSLALLLRFAGWVNDNWSELIDNSRSETAK